MKPHFDFCFLYRSDEYELHYHECGVDTEEADALPSCKLALEERGESHYRHYCEHYGNVENEGCVLTEENGILGNVKGADRDRNARNENEVEDVRADDVTKRERAVALHKRGDGGYKLGKRCAECNNCEADNCFTYTERGCNCLT